MDAHRFDRITKRFAETGSRRALLRRLASGVAGAALAGVGLDEALARDADGTVGTAGCTANGVRCGPRRRGNQNTCASCCSRFSIRALTGQRRCSCRRNGLGCARSDQCCSGVCTGGVCRDFAGACTALRNVCAGGTGECNGNPNCACVGYGLGANRAIICVRFAPTPPQCFTCATDADCRLSGLGTRCIQNSDCCGTGLSACVTPCA